MGFKLLEVPHQGRFQSFSQVFASFMQVSRGRKSTFLEDFGHFGLPSAHDLPQDRAGTAPRGRSSPLGSLRGLYNGQF